MKYKYRQSGFTIVELLVVIIVIAILAAITIVSYNGIVNSSHDAVAKTDAKQLHEKIIMYQTTNGSYPSTVGELGFSDSQDTAYAYAVTSTTFCAKVSVGSATYFVSENSTSPSKTDCGAGDGDGGDPPAALPTPLAEWKFNEGSGTTAADSSGHGNTLTRVGGSSWTASGKTGAGFEPTIANYFTRTSGLGPDRISNWTVTLWFQRTGTSSTAYGQFMYDNDEFWAEVKAAGEWGYGGVYSSGILPLNEWHHLTFVVEPINTPTSKMTFYRDGVYSHEATLSGDMRFFHENHSWMFGRGPSNGSDGAVKGIIDDLRVYDATLTPAQIQANMNL